MSKSKKSKKGFTIIEVVLVLAIAGLIFMMVFVALPALQRSQRDTARKNNVSIVAAAVTSYSNNNRGLFPTALALQDYIGEVTETVTIGTPGANAGLTVSDGSIVVTNKSTCGTSSAASQVLLPGTARQFTVTTRLEAGAGAHYCQNT